MVLCSASDLKEAIVKFSLAHPEERYRRPTYMMIDSDIVSVSPTSVYRVLNARVYLKRWNHSSSKKGGGFREPKRAHEHWHIDISYFNKIIYPLVKYPMGMDHGARRTDEHCSR